MCVLSICNWGHYVILHIFFPLLYLALRFEALISYHVHPPGNFRQNVDLKDSALYFSRGNLENKKQQVYRGENSYFTWNGGEKWRWCYHVKCPSMHIDAFPTSSPTGKNPPKKEARRLLASSSPKMEGGEKAVEGSLHDASEKRRNEGAT